MEYLKSTTIKHDLRDVLEHQRKHIILNTHETLMKIDHVLGLKASFGKFQGTGILQAMLLCN